ncbi:MAG: alpha/beta hydrolase [Acidimicrobiales bacterium]
MDEAGVPLRSVVEAMRAVWPDLGGAVTDVTQARHMVAAIPELGPLPEVERVEDRVIDGPGGDPMPVRITWPLPTGGSGEPLPGRPVVVYFHGGGWVLGGLDTHDHLVRELTNAVGAVVVSVDYRLAPEHPFPAAVEDAWAATCYVAEHAVELGGDPRRVAVAGDSAGGNLAAVTAIKCRDEGGPPLAFQLLIYPVTDSDLNRPSYGEPEELQFLTRAHMEWYWDRYVSDPALRGDPRCAPLRTADLSRLPPAYIATAEHDPLRDEGKAYGDRLSEAGGIVEHHCFGGLAHGFSNVSEFLPAARVANDAIFTSTRRALQALRAP